MILKKKERLLFLRPLSPDALKESIITLGASFIKLAQVLATRADFFTPPYLEQLKSLHDDLPPMNQKDFEVVYKNAFETLIFEHFDNEPIASASIGQVHIGYIAGQKVAVKLRRLGIKERVKADISIISFFNRLFRPLFSHYTKNSIEAVITEFAKMILEEVSMNRELQNLQKFSAMYAKSGIRFPVPLVDYCSDDALVMSFEEGFRFDDKERLLSENIDFREIIGKLISFYTEQMLLKGYFHADPHPGNLLINPQGELILLDFGMVKTIPNDTRIAIIELIKAANERDCELYISASKRLGTIAYEAPKAELALLSERMFDIFGNENLSSENMQKLAFEVLNSTKDLPFKLPQEAIYILRVSAIIEGLGTTYIENFNGIKDILPILQENIPKALGAQEGLLEMLIKEFKSIPLTIRDIKSSLKQISDGELKVELSLNQLEWLTKEVKDYFKPILLSFTLLLGGIFCLLYDPNFKELALVLFSLGVARLIFK
ncbi:MAG: AarF/UbiB family protein [Sulfurospirillaceae bacterium]|nr:AarF/UbiB family protein [Sulfurospirillaceae bacterium]